MQRQITVVTSIIRNSQGDILLAKRHQPGIPEIHGIWEFPGGKIEFGEDPLDAIKREVKEELGVEVEVHGLLPKIISNTFRSNQVDQLQALIISYECTIVSGTPTAKPEHKIAEVKFVPLNEVKNYETLKNVQDAVKLLKAKQ